MGIREIVDDAEAPASSEPEPSWIVMLTPVALTGPPPTLGFPVKLPGENVEIPRLPVT
jgi:hypothetical protein